MDGSPQPWHPWKILGFGSGERPVCFLFVEGRVSIERERVAVCLHSCQCVCQQCNNNCSNSLNSSKVLQCPEQCLCEGSFNLAADSQLGIQTRFSFVSSMECAFFPSKPLDSHFEIRPSLIAFQHYQYSHSKPCKCKLENKKCSHSCKKCCKC